MRLPGRQSGRMDPKGVHFSTHCGAFVHSSGTRAPFRGTRRALRDKVRAFHDTALAFRDKGAALCDRHALFWGIGAAGRGNRGCFSPIQQGQTGTLGLARTLLT